jgi:CRP/FNR family cyclic AMP-dependent transcriptional regulator
MGKEGIMSLKGIVTGSMGTPTGDNETAVAEVPCMETLRQTRLFAGLSEAQLKLVTPPCHQMPACDGRIFFSEGDEGRELFILLKGRVCLQVEVSLGHHLPPKIIEVETVKENGVFGLCSLIEPRRMLLTARCVADSHIIAINGDRLRALMRSNPAIGMVVMENIVGLMRERLARTQQRLIAELGLAAMYHAHRNY